MRTGGRRSRGCEGCWGCRGRDWFGLVSGFVGLEKADVTFF